MCSSAVAARPPEAEDDACRDEQRTGDIGGARLAEAERDGGEQRAYGYEAGEEARTVGAEAAQRVVPEEEGGRGDDRTEVAEGGRFAGCGQPQGGRAVQGEAAEAAARGAGKDLMRCAPASPRRRPTGSGPCG
ncbi:hypothetical protein GCM10010439_60450 [Actinocorallia aurantiaca]|uniref:Uncharacterized protein n=1 Tax=Actinocorallia aurantiaca TaxID=46204 RepID=A0ABN3UM52_9ACTN